MHDLLIYLKARIGWCQQQARAATNVKDQQGWWAEEAGLVDALRERRSPSSSQESFGEHLTRYQLGLQEGLAIMRLIKPSPVPKSAYEVYDENRHESQDGQNDKVDGQSRVSPRSPPASWPPPKR